VAHILTGAGPAVEAVIDCRVASGPALDELDVSTMVFVVVTDVFIVVADDDNDVEDSDVATAVTFTL
jgi:hypothetical protein